MKAQLAQLQEMCAERGRDFDAMDITLIVPASNFGVGEKPSFFEGLEEDPKNAGELIAEYEDAGVNRIIVGLDDMTDAASCANREGREGLGAELRRARGAVTGRSRGHQCDRMTSARVSRSCCGFNIATRSIAITTAMLKAMEPGT